MIQSEYDKMYDDVIKSTADIELAISNLNKKIQGYIEAIGNGLYCPELKETLEKAELQREMLKEQLVAYKNLKKHKVIDKDDLQKVLKKDFNKLKTDKYSLFHKWIRDIKLYDDKAEVSFTVFDDKIYLYKNMSKNTPNENWEIAVGGECPFHDILATMFTIEI